MIDEVPVEVGTGQGMKYTIREYIRDCARLKYTVPVRTHKHQVHGD